MNDLQTYIYSGTQLRTIQLDDGLWWVLKDVCQVLELASPHKVAERLDEDEKGRNLIPTLGGTQEVTIINEPGLYNVILRSDKPEARAFKRWVTHEVLPSIRKTGCYETEEHQKAVAALSKRLNLIEHCRQRVNTCTMLTSNARKNYETLRREKAKAIEDLALFEWSITYLMEEVTRTAASKSSTGGQKGDNICKRNL